GPATRRRPRFRVVHRQRVFCFAWDIRARDATASADDRQPLGPRLRHLFRPLFLRDLAAVPSARRALVRDRQRRNRVRRLARSELGADGGGVPHSDRRAGDGRQAARVGASALTRQPHAGRTRPPTHLNPCVPNGAVPSGADCQASPVGTIVAVSIIRTTAFSGARVRWITPFGTTKPCCGESATERPSRSMMNVPLSTKKNSSSLSRLCQWYSPCMTPRRATESFTLQSV